MKIIKAKGVLTLISVFCFTFAFTQQSPIEVASKTFKLTGEESFYYGFAEGDEIVFDFEVVDGKPVKEIEILALPESSRFMDWKSKKISGQRIKVNQKGIYEFRYRNGGLGRKVCKIKIQRIPASEETVSFNPAVEWKTRRDTTWVQKSRKVLDKVDTVVIEQVNRTERVHSQTNIENSNVSSFWVDFPRAGATPMQTRETVSWAYWIGVGNAGAAAYEAEKKRFMQTSGVELLSAASPLAGLALGVYTIAANPPEGDNIHFWLHTDFTDGRSFSHGSGNSVIAYGRVDNYTQGGFNVTLKNDNIMNGINVNVKIAFVQLIKTYKMVGYEEAQVTETKYPDFSGE